MRAPRLVVATALAIAGSACGGDRRDAPPVAQAPPPAPPPGWSETAAHGCTLHFPDARRVERVTRDEVDVDLVIAEPVDGVTYMLMTSAAGEAGKDADASMRRALSGMIATSRGRLKVERRIAMSGRPAMEYRIDAAGSELHGRIVIGNDRMYILSAVAAAGAARTHDEAFFGSFRLTR